MDPIFQRVSVRKFASRPVEPEKIEQLLRAAMAAPSATNQQPWEFLVVTDPALLEALSHASDGGEPPKAPAGKPPMTPPPAGDRPHGGPAACCKDAPLAIVVLGNQTRMRCPENWQQDLGAATENILLEAVQQGLGGVWLGIATLENRMDNIRRIFSLPEELLPYCILALGYPAEQPKPQQDRYCPAYVHYNGL
jgi:nitroreductase